MSENLEKEKTETEERYLFIYCAGSGYATEIIEFFKNCYLTNGKYHDILAHVGSILPLIFSKIDNYCSVVDSFRYYKEIYNFFIDLRTSLKLQIRYLIGKHQLNKVVVVGEPECAFYKDLSFFVDMGNKVGKYSGFPSQEIAFFTATTELDDFLSAEFGKDKIILEAWYLRNIDNEVVFEKIYNNQCRSFFSIFAEEGG